MAKGSVNKATILGNLGDAPVLRYTSGGTAVASVSVATTERFKKGDTYEDRTDWHRLVFYSGLAEVAHKYLKKGSKVYVEGRMQKRRYQDANKVDHDVFEIIVQELQMLGEPRSAEQKEQDAYNAAYAGSHSVANPDAEPDLNELPAF